MEYPIHSVVMHITTGVCRIQDIQEKQFTEDQHQKYYVLQPIFEKGTTLFVPIENDPVRIRPLLKKKPLQNCCMNYPHKKMNHGFTINISELHILKPF